MTHSLGAQKQLRAASKELMAQKVLPLPLNLKSSLGVEEQRAKNASLRKCEKPGPRRDCNEFQ